MNEVPLGKWDPHYLKPFEERTILGVNQKEAPPDTLQLAELIRVVKGDGEDDI